MLRCSIRRDLLHTCSVSDLKPSDIYDVNSREGGGGKGEGGMQEPTELYNYDDVHESRIVVEALHPTASYLKTCTCGG